MSRRGGRFADTCPGSAVVRPADHLSPGSYAMPDQVWYAWYNGRADVDVDPRWIRAHSWYGQRVHQYEAHTTVAYGGVALTVDRNFMELDGGSRGPRSTRACGGTRLDFAC